MVTETDRNKARSAVVSAYHEFDCVTIPFSFLHAFADAAVDAVSTDAEPVALYRSNEKGNSWLQWLKSPDGYADGTALYAEPVKTAPAVAVKAKLIADLREMAESITYAEEPSRVMREAADALSAQVQDGAGSGYSLDQIKAAYIAGYAQGNCLSGTLEGDEEWEEYFSCVVDTASPVSKHGDAD